MADRKMSDKNMGIAGCRGLMRVVTSKLNISVRNVSVEKVRLNDGQRYGLMECDYFHLRFILKKRRVE
jgi:hypothetical protein